jgi:hypothetical protein
VFLCNEGDGGTGLYTEAGPECQEKITGPCQSSGCTYRLFWHQLTEKNNIGLDESATVTPGNLFSGHMSDISSSFSKEYRWVETSWIEWCFPQVMHEHESFDP